jgi:hypothetical protein
MSGALSFSVAGARGNSRRVGLENYAPIASSFKGEARRFADARHENKRKRRGVPPLPIVRPAKISRRPS